MRQIRRRDFLRGLGLAAGAGIMAGGCVTGSGPGIIPDRRKPNIIFILADDLGYGDLGCYGQEQIRTPNIDAMAEQGMRFTQCYAGSTVCAPSRCCLMTGMHTGHAHVRGNARVPLRPEDVTVAEVLNRAGYRTALIGKWGLGEPDTTGIPNRQGFDYFFGYLNQGRAHNYYPEYLWRNKKQFPLEGNVESEEHDRVSVECEQYSHDLFAQGALDYVEHNADKPFFLYLAYTIPHANNERGRAEGDGMEVPDYGPYEARQWPNPQKAHAAMITRMDADIGRLFDKLKELGIDEDTIVFFTSDNGPHKEGGADPAFFQSSGPLYGMKRDVYEGGIRVPGIVRWPGVVPAGEVSDHVWAFWDFLPTAAELGGGRIPEGIDGISFAPALVGEGVAGHAQQEHEFLYWEFHERGSKQAVRMGDWKAIRKGPGKPLELYDLSQDIGEVDNVAEEHPDVVAKIEAYLKIARTESEHWPIQEAKKK